MTDEAPTLGFGVTFDTVAAETACGQLLALSSHADHDENPPHRHENDYVCLVLSGSFAELRKEGWRDRRSGAFFVHRAGDTHNDRFGPDGAICLSIHFATHNHARCGGVEGVCSTPARVAADRLAFELAAGRREELVLASLASEILGELRLARTRQKDRAGWLDRIVEAIADDPTRRWSLGELAGIAQRHPVHIAQSFRATTGMSLGAFQRRRRLVSLSLALRSGRTSLVSLASDFGYCDQSHMNAEFRSAFGISPGRYRQAFQ